LEAGLFSVALTRAFQKPGFEEKAGLREVAGRKQRHDLAKTSAHGCVSI
jgi:hypothetical protein